MIQQANEVAREFERLPREQAIEGVRKHIELFWEAARREQLVALVAQGGAGLHELVIEAVRRMAIQA